MGNADCDIGTDAASPLIVEPDQQTSGSAGLPWSPTSIAFSWRRSSTQTFRSRPSWLRALTHHWPSWSSRSAGVNAAAEPHASDQAAPTAATYWGSGPSGFKVRDRHGVKDNRDRSSPRLRCRQRNADCDEPTQRGRRVSLHTVTSPPPELVAAAEFGQKQSPRPGSDLVVLVTPHLHWAHRCIPGAVPTKHSVSIGKPARA